MYNLKGYTSMMLEHANKLAHTLHPTQKAREHCHLGHRSLQKCQAEQHHKTNTYEKHQYKVMYIMAFESKRIMHAQVNLSCTTYPSFMKD